MKETFEIFVGKHMNYEHPAYLGINTLIVEVERKSNHEMLNGWDIKLL